MRTVPGVWRAHQETLADSVDWTCGYCGRFVSAGRGPEKVIVSFDDEWYCSAVVVICPSCDRPTYI